MFTDGLTNKLVGGWREGAREDTVLVRSSKALYWSSIPPVENIF